MDLTDRALTLRSRQREGPAALATPPAIFQAGQQLDVAGVHMFDELVNQHPDTKLVDLAHVRDANGTAMRRTGSGFSAAFTANRCNADILCLLDVL